MSGWTAEQDRDLLLTMIAEHPPGKGDWAIISTKFGQGKTAEACRQHYAKLLKSGGATKGSKSASGDNTDSGATEGAKNTRGVAKKVQASKKRKADIAVAEDGSGGSAADTEGFEGFENLEDVKSTLEAAKNKAKGAAKQKAAAKVKAEPKPKATRSSKKAKAEDVAHFKTVNYSQDEGMGEAYGGGGQSE